MGVTIRHLYDLLDAGNNSVSGLTSLEDAFERAQQVIANDSTAKPTIREYIQVQEDAD